MNKKDKSWFFLLFLVLALYSAYMLFQKGQIAAGEALVVLGIIFFIISLFFYFKSKKNNSVDCKISILKKIVIIIFSFLILGALLNFFVPAKTTINQEKIETEIQALIEEQEKLSRDIDKLHQQENIKEAGENVSKIEKNIERVLGLNQILIYNAPMEQKENLLERQKVLETALTIFNEIEKCMNFYPDDMNNFNNCQKEIEEMLKTITPASKQ